MRTVAPAKMRLLLSRVAIMTVPPFDVVTVVTRRLRTASSRSSISEEESSANVFAERRKASVTRLPASPTRPSHPRPELFCVGAMTYPFAPNFSAIAEILVICSMVVELYAGRRCPTLQLWLWECPVYPTLMEIFWKKFLW